MIVRPQPTFWDILFALKGSIAKQIALRLLAITLLALLVTLVSFRDPALFAQLGTGPFTLVGLSLSIFMSFRNSACYDRWWEGRRQWGGMIGEVRSLIRDAAAGDADPDRAAMLRAVCGFLHALAADLRGQDAAAAARPWLPKIGASANIPDGALQAAGRAFDALTARGIIGAWHVPLVGARLHALSAAQVACERIRSTPLPFAYTLLLHRTAYLFCCLLPFGIAGALGWATPFVTAIVGYTFFGLDALGNELEQPFGFEPNDLPLDALVRVMERDIRAALGETDLPPLLAPIDFLLQ